ncbi:MAG: Spy/CpxP family protein refolding chaperone [Phormidesmis sp.]
MKFNLKTFSLVGFSAVALLATPFVVTHSVSAQGEGGRRGGHSLEQLDLSASQTSQIEAIRDDAKAQMQTVLTAEQRATLESSEDRGRQAFRQLDLSETQREQLRAIHEDSREDISAVLTDEQLEQLEAMREERGSRRGARAEGSRPNGDAR